LYHTNLLPNSNQHYTSQMRNENVRYKAVKTQNQETKNREYPPQKPNQWCFNEGWRAFSVLGSVFSVLLSASCAAQRTFSVLWFGKARQPRGLGLGLGCSVFSHFLIIQFQTRTKIYTPIPNSFTKLTTIFTN